eukprot:comp22512_c0_seq1/m.56338 comp22512_c0_seq1/g.56338  ORF comp22512_c0_seq1/g.56338 comp22512_c0_seq1/m.56338 type:complete len:324 (-) comp22512_c0_seq1:1368-2339(-)
MTIAGFVGGALVSLSTSLNMTLFGRITGFSGILWSVANAPNEQKKSQPGLPWKIGFLAGFLGSGVYLAQRFPDLFRPIGQHMTIGTAALAGLLVGVGTRLSNGCTSGHGVCGIPRLSPRSITATAVFFSTGVATANLIEAVSPTEFALLPHHGAVSFSLVAPIAAYIAYVTYIFRGDFLSKKGMFDTFSAAALGAIFASGLTFSGMTDPDVIFRGLLVLQPSKWQIDMFVVFAAAVGLNLLTFQTLFRASPSRPLLAPAYDFKPNNTIDTKLVGGAALFGLGWGLSGLCPAPALLLAQYTTTNSVLFLASMFSGMALANKYFG